MSSPNSLSEMAASGESAPLLEVRGLSMSYGIGRVGKREEVAALTDLDLTVPRGEVLGLVGESGSGKTTFARTLVYLERLTAGTIAIDGDVVPKHPSPARLREHRREVQMIFQDPYSSLDPLHTVASAVTQPLRAFKIVSRREERGEVEDLLHQVGLTPVKDFLKRYPHELSGGQRQRVGIARALAARPKVANRRRADLDAGRLDPPDDHELAPRPAEQSRALTHLHYSRPRVGSLRQ